MKAYCISGLGADYRVYQNLKINYEKVDLQWIKPLKDEPLKDYALRLSQAINEKEDYIIIGVSFGGVIAVEIAKLLSPKLVILVSSIQTSEELPIIYKTIGKLKLQRVLPTSFFNLPFIVAKALFGTDSVLLKDIIRDTDPTFVKWAVNALLEWENSILLNNLVLICGTRDRVLSSKKTNYTIKNGGHFMIVDKAGEIAEIINSVDV